MKLALLSKTIAADMNGYGRYTKAVANELKKIPDLEIKIFTRDKSGDYSFPTLIFKNNLLLVFWSFFYLKRLIKDCDSIHALDGYPYGVMGIFAKLGTRKKLFISALGSYAVQPLFEFFSGMALRFAYKKANTVFAASRFTKKKIEDLVPLNNITVVNMGVDINFTSCIDNGGLSDSLPEEYILSVGALKYRKGYHISIPAFAKTKKRFPELHYVIVGSQESINYHNRLKELIRQYGLEDSVIFFSNVPDNSLSYIYQKAKLFLLTSVTGKGSFEGFGIVYLEAGLFGLSSIGSKDSGAEDAISDNETGFLTNQNDIDDIADKMLFLLSHDSARSRFGENARRRAQKFSWKNIVDQYSKSYYK